MDTSEYHGSDEKCKEADQQIMKVKQLTLKGFEFDIDSDDAFVQYYTKNAPLLQGHQLILKGEVSEGIKDFLEQKKAVYVDSNEKTVLTRKKRSSPLLETPAPTETKMSEPGDIKPKSSEVYYRPIRSGEAIDSLQELVFFGRINNGAIIESSGSIQVFGIIDGLVRCDGAYMLLKEIGQGSVLFHGEELDKSQFSGQLKLIKYENDAIVIKEIK